MTNLIPVEESFCFAQTFWPKVSKKVMMSAWAILKFTSWGVTPNIAIIIHHATLCPDFFLNRAPQGCLKWSHAGFRSLLIVPNLTLNQFVDVFHSNNNLIRNSDLWDSFAFLLFSGIYLSPLNLCAGNMK